MSIVSMKEILEKAMRGNYAVGSYNAYDLTTIRGVIAAAESQRAPVILCHAPVHFKYTPLGSVANLMRYEAKKASVPIALLLDHGYDTKTCMDAIDAGLNGVMIDASSKSFEENIAQVKEVVKIAHSKNCHVEAELGHVTRPKSGGAEGEDSDDVIDDTSLYTDPKKAVEFILRTGTDSLAIAFGTAHGLYLKTPKLDLDRLSRIREAVNIPLVMHGGSGLSDNDFIQVVRRGINKINYYTGMAAYAGDSIKRTIQNTEGQVFYHNIMISTIEAIKIDVVRSMKLFGCCSKA